MQPFETEVIKLMGVKPFTQRLEQIIIPTCIYHNPIITLKFPFNKSDSRTRFLQFSHEGIELECWADEEGFIYEVNLLTYKVVRKGSAISCFDVEKGIPYFDFGQNLMDSKTIRIHSSEVSILWSREDLWVEIRHADFLKMKWIGIGMMYYGINESEELCGFLFKGIDFAGYL